MTELPLSGTSRRNRNVARSHLGNGSLDDTHHPLSAWLMRLDFL